MTSRFPKACLTPLMLCVAGSLVAGAVSAQEYPAPGKPVTFILPYAAGGPTDKAARDLAQSMSKAMGGHSIVVENAPGASGSIGAAKAAKAANDGYTLLFTHIAQATLPTFFRNLPYNVEKDFEYLGLVSENPMNLIARPTLAANNIGELISWVQANKGKISIANAGPGSASHLCGMLFQSTLKVDMVSVPYKGTAPAMTDLIGGQIQLNFDTPVTSIPHVKAGRLRALAITGTKRLATLPDVPTFAEAGLPAYDFQLGFGVLAPAGTPRPIVEKLSTEIARILAMPDVKQQLAEQGLDTAYRSPAEFDALLRADHERFGKLIRSAGIKIE